MSEARFRELQKKSSLVVNSLAPGFAEQHGQVYIAC